MIRLGFGTIRLRIVLLVALVALSGAFLGGKVFNRAAVTQAASGEDLRILKSQVSSTAKFYPYRAGNTYMEVIAVRASDGSIRTALNTCQVCFNSGRGYYTQAGNELVCNNCGNRFRIDQVEVVRGGCNPVPILKENKTDDGKYIVISKDFLDKTKSLFARWKR